MGKKGKGMPTRQTKSPNTHTIKPTRRAQSMVKKPTPKNPSTDLKVQKEITTLKYMVTVYQKLMAQCKDKKCSKTTVCDKRHYCVKPVKPKCKLSEILMHGKCLEKCKSGYVMHKNGKCVKIVAQKCPAGTKKDPKTKKCIKVIKIVPTKDCPKGFTRDPKTKICKKHLPPKCKKDEKLVKGKCVKAEKTQNCPKGYTKDKKSGDCISTVATCPKGYTLTKGQCTK